MSIRTLAEVTPSSITWLWLGRLALGKLTLLDGHANLGKSWIALDLCARLSRGQPWPDGAAASAPAHSIYCSAEDNDGDTLAPRLHALGADPQLVHLWESDKPLLRLPEQLKDLEQLLVQTDARLLVLDPLAAFVEPGWVGNNDRIRGLLNKLAVLAHVRRCAILFLRNLIKRAGGPALQRGAGAMTIGNVCRLDWLAARDPLDASRCVLGALKNNLAAAPPSMAYRVTTSPDGAGALEWLGISPWTPDQGVANRGGRPAHRRARAVRMLTKFLSKEPRLARDVMRFARRRRISSNTLYSARKKAGVDIQRIPCRGEVLIFWLLPGQELPDFLRAHLASLQRAAKE